MNNNNKILRYLVKDVGVDTNHPNKKGETPLQRCQAAKNQEGVDILAKIDNEAFHKANLSLLEDVWADEIKKGRSAAKNAKKR